MTVIRPAVPADLPAIAAIYAEAVRNGTASYELEPPSLAEMTRRFEALAGGSYPYLVAEADDVALGDGAVLGYAYAGPFRPRPAYRFMVEDSIYLAPQARGRGLGRLLLERLVEAVRELGFRQMVAVIGDGFAGSASVRLHERMGFRHAGGLTASGYKHGRWLDTIFMQLSLNGGGDVPPDPDSLPERRYRGKF
jgi:phosphinothricin acetyltransferase